MNLEEIPGLQGKGLGFRVSGLGFNLFGLRV